MKVEWRTLAGRCSARSSSGARGFLGHPPAGDGHEAPDDAGQDGGLKGSGSDGAPEPSTTPEPPPWSRHRRGAPRRSASASNAGRRACPIIPPHAPGAARPLVVRQLLRLGGGERCAAAPRHGERVRRRRRLGSQQGHQEDRRDGGRETAASSDFVTAAAGRLMSPRRGLAEPRRREVCRGASGYQRRAPPSTCTGRGAGAPMLLALAGRCFRHQLDQQRQPRAEHLIVRRSRRERRRRRSSSRCAPARQYSGEGSARHDRGSYAVFHYVGVSAERQYS
jgi:hypothetical protein